MSAAERIRWRCRRGMLELDLVLDAFLARHLENLAPAQLEAFGALLEESDPQLLELVMGRAEAADPGQREILELVRSASFATKHARPPGRGRAEARVSPLFET